MSHLHFGKRVIERCGDDQQTRGNSDEVKEVKGIREGERILHNESKSNKGKEGNGL
jgi:hypothetical protein